MYTTSAPAAGHGKGRPAGTPYHRAVLQRWGKAGLVGHGASHGAIKSLGGYAETVLGQTAAPQDLVAAISGLSAPARNPPLSVHLHSLDEPPVLVLGVDDIHLAALRRTYPSVHFDRYFRTRGSRGVRELGVTVSWVDGPPARDVVQLLRTFKPRVDVSTQRLLSHVPAAIALSGPPPAKYAATGNWRNPQSPLQAYRLRGTENRQFEVLSSLYMDALLEHQVCIILGRAPFLATTPVMFMRPGDKSFRAVLDTPNEVVALLPEIDRRFQPLHESPLWRKGSLYFLTWACSLSSRYFLTWAYSSQLHWRIARLHLLGQLLDVARVVGRDGLAEAGRSRDLEVRLVYTALQAALAHREEICGLAQGVMRTCEGILTEREQLRSVVKAALLLRHYTDAWPTALR